MSDKNREIEEMAKVLEMTERKKMDSHCDLPSVEEYATDLYNAGYRKQREGEWVKDAPHWRHHCNQCGYFPLMLHGDFFPFCPNCGAKMRKEDDGK